MIERTHAPRPSARSLARAIWLWIKSPLGRRHPRIASSSGIFTTDLREGGVPVTASYLKRFGYLPPRNFFKLSGCRTVVSPRAFSGMAAPMIGEAIERGISCEGSTDEVLLFRWWRRDGRHFLGRHFPGHWERVKAARAASRVEFAYWTTRDTFGVPWAPDA